MHANGIRSSEPIRARNYGANATSPTVGDKGCDPYTLEFEQFCGDQRAERLL